jgi:hypothetical protein
LQNEEILKVLRELHGEVGAINTRAAGPLPIPPELRPGAAVDPAERAKTLDAYTARVYDLPPKQWTKEQQALVREQIKSVLGTL